MTEMNSAAQSRDRRRVNALAESLRRALAGVEMTLDGLSERDKLIVLHVALDRQLQIDKAHRHGGEEVRLARGAAHRPHMDG